MAQKLNTDEFLEQFKRDVVGITDTEVTEPMNIHHAAMYDSYKKGYERGIKHVPNSGGESLTTRLKRRLTKHFEMNDKVYIYHDTYNKKVSFRSKPSKTAEEDLLTTAVGMFRNINTAKKVVARLVELGEVE